MAELLDDVESAAGLTVLGASSVPGAVEARARLVADGVPGRLAGQDPGLWGPAAEADAKVRLGWLDTHRRSRELVPALDALSRRHRETGLDHVVLVGMGGSSLAPQVIAATLGVDLTVLDTTDPHRVRAVLADRPERTVVVMASKSGATVETESHRRAYLQAFEDAGVPDPGRRFVVVTDPGSALERTAHEMGAHLFLADPEVGGRFSALTAFGLVPSALAGVAVTELLDQADELSRTLGSATDNPALALGVALGAAARAGRDRLALAADGTGIVGLDGWIEQLIAESTGKQGRGLLPVVLESPDSPGRDTPDTLTTTVGGSLRAGSVPGGGVVPDLAVNGPLGAHFLAWEYATAIAALLIEVNPFDQPDVAGSKEHTDRTLDSGPAASAPTFVDGAVEVHGPTAASTLAGALDELVRGLHPRGYLAVMAWLDRLGDAPAAELRPVLAARTDRAVTFGWAPRLLHSTGQFHKGGPSVGSFLQITGAVGRDLPVPGRPYTFGELQAAQAAGDRQSLTGLGRPFLRLHLTDRAAGTEQLLSALGG